MLEKKTYCSANIYLTGFMGSGKSSVGRGLAKALNWDFADSDALIVKKAGKNIPRIFAEDGEETFRHLEARVIKSLAEKKKLVASLGGGAILRAETRRLLAETGKTVYLSASADTILERAAKQKNTRPLLKAENDEERLRAIRRLLKERLPLYEQADMTVRTDGKTLSEVLNVLLRELRR